MVCASRGWHMLCPERDKWALYADFTPKICPFYAKSLPILHSCNRGWKYSTGWAPDALNACTIPCFNRCSSSSWKISSLWFASISNSVTTKINGHSHPDPVGAGQTRPVTGHISLSGGQRVSDGLNRFWCLQKRPQLIGQAPTTIIWICTQLQYWAKVQMWGCVSREGKIYTWPLIALIWPAWAKGYNCWWDRWQNTILPKLFLVFWPLLWPFL